MLTFLKIATLISLGVLIYQDFRFRMVHIWALAICALLLLLSRFISFSYTEVLMDWLKNLGLISVNFILASLYFSIKQRKWVLLTNGLIGEGDLVFFLIMALSCSFNEFCLLLPACLLITLLCWIAFVLLRKPAENRIPLAGLMCIPFGIWVWLAEPLFLSTQLLKSLGA